MAHDTAKGQVAIVNGFVFSHGLLDGKIIINDMFDWDRIDMK